MQNLFMLLACWFVSGVNHYGKGLLKMKNLIPQTQFLLSLLENLIPQSYLTWLVYHIADEIPV